MTVPEDSSGNFGEKVSVVQLFRWPSQGVINNNNIEFTEEGADVHFRSLIRVAQPEIDDPEHEPRLLLLDKMKEIFVM
jgi:hypothetical protein